MPFLTLALVLPPAPQEFFDFPADVRAFCAQEIERLSYTRYRDEAYYDALRAHLERRVFNRSDGIRLFHALYQAMVDHEREREWVVRFAFELERDEMAPVRAAAVPEQVERLRVTLRDGRVLFGSGGPLSRIFRDVPPEQLEGQSYLDVDIGLPGAGTLWLARGEADLVERVSVPAPKAFLVEGYREAFDPEGRLAIEGHWYRPGRGIALETVRLDVGDVTDGGLWISSEELGIRAIRYTSDYPELARVRALSVDFQRAMGWIRDAPEAEPPPPRSLLDRIERLRRLAPEVEWPEPFDPDPVRAVHTARRGDLSFGDDPEDDLLRLRFSLVYGGDMPEIARLHPREFLDIERRVIAFLDGRPREHLLERRFDVGAVRAALSHATRFDREPGPQAPAPPVLLQLPDDYSPWRRFPVLIALHGQGGAPADEFVHWRDLCRERSVILVCPPHGSASGGGRGKESDDALLDVVRRVLLSTNADPDRVYLTGISMGGARTWLMVQGHPGRFAAAAPEIRGPTRIHGRFPLLSNVAAARIAIFQTEGEFDGENTRASRRAIFELKKLSGIAEYFEAPWLGHARMVWRYPSVLDRLLRARRDPHPREIDHRAFVAFRGRNAWLRLVSAGGAYAFDREDGAFVVSDLCGVHATVEDGVVRLKKTAGRPAKVEIFHDPVLMGDRVEILAGTRRITWRPAPSLERTLDRVWETGDRARLYGDSIVVEM